MVKDLTKGSLLKNIIRFSLPFLLSYFLQTLYGLADLFIIGQYNGSEVISAVSIGSQVTHMVTVIVVGLAMGSLVMIGRFVGAGKQRDISKTIGNTVTVFAVFGTILTIVLWCLTSFLVGVMSTPSESVLQTTQYLRICFAGIPFIVAYNVISSIFRGMGDSKSPMYFIAIACAVNILLDYIFIGYFDMQASGAAMGTILAQAFSVFISLAVIVKRKIITIRKSDLRLDPLFVRNLFQIGLPVALQDGFIQMSFMVITVIANRRGVEVAAAVGIVEKIISFLFLIPSSMMSTISAIASQSIGADRKDLARKVMFLGMKISLSIGVMFVVLLQFFAGNAVAVFTTENEVIRLGAQYLKSYSYDLAVASVHFCFSGFFVACGYSYISFFHNLLSILLLRIPLAFLASVYFPENLFPMGLASPAGGLLQITICVVAYNLLRKRERI